MAPASARSPGGSFSAASEQACRLSRDIASVMCDVPSGEIARSGRSAADTCHARHLAMYLAHVVFQVPLSSIASDFGRDRTSVAYAVRRIEDRRDLCGFDAEVARMERLAGLCRQLMGTAPSARGGR